MPETIGFAIIVVLTAAFTGLIRSYSVSKGMFDTPNARSSHEIPTPRGGGLSMLLVFVAVMVFLLWQGALSADIFFAMSVGSALIGIVGFVDDHQSVSAVYRIVVHAAAAVVAVLLIDASIVIEIGSAEVEAGVIGQILSVLFIVWMVNLFNFMDGIDGIAGVEGFFILLAAAAISSFAGTDLESNRQQFVLLELGLAAACIGFLIWNWPPAKIFMGDVGSGFLGFAIGALAITSVAYQNLPVWTWLILIAVFFVDATATLIRRVLTGMRWYEAHRSHGYQRAARRYGSHLAVTLAVLAFNVCWLLPLAWFATLHAESGWWLTSVAWCPLTVAWGVLGGGRGDSE